MKRLRRYRPLALALLPLAILLVPVVAHAALRPGGGQSYSGSSSSGSSGSSSSGGGGDGGAGFIIDLIILCFEYPQLGIPLLLIVVTFLIVRAVMRSRQNDWGTQGSISVASSSYGPGYVAPGYVPPEAPQPVAATQGIPRSRLDAIRQTDPDFSVALFEDFLYTLYSHAQTARPRGQITTLGAYLAPAVQQTIGHDPSLEAIGGIVIGAMRFHSVGSSYAKAGDPEPQLQVVVDFEANLTEVHRGQQARYFVVDRLTLSRRQGAKSRPPARSRTLDCPNCGAPLQSVQGDMCSFCKQHVGYGKFDWTVTSWERITTESRPPLLTSDVEEKGTNLPTVVDPGARPRFAALSQRDPAFDWNQFQARVNLTFQELQVAWSGRDFMRARPFVTDNLFQSQMYWINLYIEQRARNVTENARIQSIELANVMSDKYFDALTVRIYASSLDYTISNDGRLLSGSRSKVRQYSEYWTFVRGAGRTGQPTKTTPNCSNCGAPMKISMAGNCEYCKAKVTSGEFDWVLSRIEQDDSYTG